MEKFDATALITYWNVDWLKIKVACMTTISKKAKNIPDSEWKRKLLICEHSPLRRGEISWKWENIPYAISTHFARHHEGCEKFIGTSREDRTGKKRQDRSQMDYVPMEMDANIQALINISAKRLCFCADPITREYWKSLLLEIKKKDADIFWACVPQCIRCGSCVEPFSNCNFYNTFSKNLAKEEQSDIFKRYECYNDFRNKE